MSGSVCQQLVIIEHFCVTLEWTEFRSQWNILFGENNLH